MKAGYQLVTKKYRRRKNEGATFFCLPKILDRNPGPKKGCFFCLMSHLVAPKILDKKKGVVLFGLPKILDQKKNEGETFFAYQKSWTKKRGELFLLNVPPSCPKNPEQEKNECEAFCFTKNFGQDKN